MQNTLYTRLTRDEMILELATLYAKYARSINLTVGIDCHGQASTGNCDTPIKGGHILYDERSGTSLQELSNDELPDDLKNMYRSIDEYTESHKNCLIATFSWMLEIAIDNQDLAIAFKSEPETVDGDGDGDDFVILRDGDRDLQFAGQHIAHVSSYSADNDRRWTEIDIYQSASGSYICHQHGATMWLGEHSRHAAKVCKTRGEVIAYLGFGRLSKEAYALAGIDCIEHIE